MFRSIAPRSALRNSRDSFEDESSILCFDSNPNGTSVHRFGALSDTSPDHEDIPAEVSEREQHFAFVIARLPARPPACLPARTVASRSDQSRAEQSSAEQEALFQSVDHFLAVTATIMIFLHFLAALPNRPETTMIHYRARENDRNDEREQSPPSRI